MTAFLLLAVTAFAGQTPQSKVDVSELRSRLHFISQNIQAGRLDEAESALDLLRADAGPAPLVEGMHGFLLYRRHQYLQGIDILKHALQSPSPPAWWRVLLAMCYVATGQDELAKAEMRQAHSEDSRAVPEALTAMYATAVVDVANSPSPEGTLALVFVSLSMGNRRAAATALTEEMKTFPTEARLRLAKIDLLADSGDIKSALTEATAALEAVVDDSRIERRAGTLFSLNGDLSQALIHLERADQLDPKNVTAKLELGRVYHQLNRLPEARKQYEDLLTLNLAPDARTLVYASLGSVLTDTKEWKYAAQVLQKGLDAAGNDPPLLSNMARLLVVSDAPDVRDPKRAVELAEKAAALSQQRNAFILDNLAEAYFASGAAQKAVDTERKALSLAPGRADFREHLSKFEAKKP